MTAVSAIRGWHRVCFTSRRRVECTRRDREPRESRGSRVGTIRGVLALALLAGMAVPAAAQTQGQFKFTDGTPYDPQPTLTVGSGVASRTGTFYTSTYRGQFLSGVPGNPTVDVFCIDFFHNANTSSTGYSAWFTPLSATDFSHTYGVSQRGWSQGIAEQRYRAAAWLATQFGDPTSATDKATWPAKQAAIWSLMGQTSMDFGANNTVDLASAFNLSGFSNETFRNTTTGLLNSALTAANTVDGDSWMVISATNGGSQEFLVQQSVVPEPETVILLVTGLLAIGAVAYFRGFSA